MKLLSSLVIVWLLSSCSLAAQPPREGTFPAAGGVHLYYRFEGKGSAKDTFVVIHGGPGLNMNVVLPDLAPLAQHHRFLIYDQRGSGRSELIKDPKLLTAQDHVEDLEALRQHFRLGTMGLVCQSWGSGLCALYAAKYPQNVRRLVLLGPMPPSKQIMDGRQKMLNAKGGAAFEKLPALLDQVRTAADPLPPCREFFAIYFKNHFFDPSAAAKMKSDACDAPPDAVRNWQTVDDATMGSLGDWDFRPGLKNFNVPTLVVEGAESHATLEGAHAWAAAMPNSRLLLIPDAGHFPMVEQPQLFFPAVEEFLAGKWPQSAVSEFIK